MKYIIGMTLDSSAANDLASAVAEPLASAAAFYFDPATLAKGKELGLSGMRFYALGRGGVLGDVDSDVITSAFGYFHPAVIAKWWDSSKEKLAPREAGTIFHECCADIGRAKLADVEGLEAFCDAAEAVIANTNPAGLALFAGIAAEPRADDLPGRAMQLAAVLRELRGSAHLNALVATGVAPEQAHAVKRPDMVEAFGWDPAPDVSGFDESKREEAEALTNRMVGRSMIDLTDDQAAALRAGAANIAAALA